MAKAFKLFIAVNLLISFAVKGQHNTTIEGKSGRPDKTSVSLISYQGYIIDTTVIMNGRFNMHVDLPGGDRYKLLYSERLGQAPDSVIIFLDEGLLKIEDDVRLKSMLVFQGSAFSTELQNYYSWRKTLKVTQSEIACLSDWVTKNSNSAISLFAIDNYLRLTGRSADYQQVKKLFDMINPSAKENILALRLDLDIQRNNTLALGKIFPAFFLPDTTGKIVSNKVLKGSYVLVDFWASWCGPCREENKVFLSLAKKYKNQNFKLVSISLDKSTEAWKAAIRTDHLFWLQLSDSKFPANQLEKALNLKLIPVDFIIDPEGTIIEKSIYGSLLEKKLDKLLLIN